MITTNTIEHNVSILSHSIPENNNLSFKSYQDPSNFKSHAIWVFSGCTDNPVTSPCSIPIRHSPEPTYSGAVNAWKVGDNYLDWYGAEPGQGSYGGSQATGSPALWTTNQKGVAEYSPLNT